MRRKDTHSEKMKYLFFEVFELKNHYLMELFTKTIASHLDFGIEANRACNKIVDHCILKKQSFKSFSDLIDFICVNPSFYPLSAESPQENTAVTKEILQNLKNAAQKIENCITELAQNKMTPQKFLRTDLSHAFLTLIQHSIERPSLSVRLLKYYNKFFEYFVTNNGPQQTGIEKIEQINSIIHPLEFFCRQKNSPKNYSSCVDQLKRLLLPRYDLLFSDPTLSLKKSFFIRVNLTNIFAMRLLEKSSLKSTTKFLEEHIFDILLDFNYDDEEYFDFFTNLSLKNIPWVDREKKKDSLVKKLFEKYEENKANKMKFLLEITIESYKKIAIRHSKEFSQSS